MEWAVILFFLTVFVFGLAMRASKRKFQKRLWWRVDGYNGQGNPVWASAATKQEALKIYVFHEGYISKITSIQQIDMGRPMK